jgi:two-component system NtrC family sensor kinase
VLSSVNVSANLLAEYVDKSKGGGLVCVAALLREHERDLDDFTTTHPQCKRLTAYLENLDRHLRPERQAAVTELDTLREKVGHAKGMFAARELDGSLTEHSDAPRRGATFTLELPLRTSRPVNGKEVARG